MAWLSILTAFWSSVSTTFLRYPCIICGIVIAATMPIMPRVIKTSAIVKAACFSWTSFWAERRILSDFKWILRAAPSEWHKKTPEWLKKASARCIISPKPFLYKYFKTLIPKILVGALFSGAPPPPKFSHIKCFHTFNPFQFSRSLHFYFNILLI